MIQRPWLSIITITRNNLNGLKRTSASIQTLLKSGKVEWVVVDGSSNDGTREFLESLSDANWKSEPDSGIYDAMNKGLERSSGQYVWFLNAGDIFSDSLNPSHLLDYLNQEADVLWSDTVLYSPEGQNLGLRSEQTTRKIPKNLIPTSFLRGMVVSHQSFICKRSICIPYNLNIKHVADYDWMIKVVKSAQKIIFLPDPICGFEVQGYSGQNRFASLRERFTVMYTHFGIIPTILSHIRIVWVNLIHSILLKK